MNPREKQTGDLWKDFMKDNEPDYVQKSNDADGSEWTGAFDRRSKPRDETPPDNHGPAD